MTERERKSKVGLLTMAGTIAYNATMQDGVCGVGTYLDRRKPLLHHTAGVHLSLAGFYELFGDDTNYEYRDHNGWREVCTEIDDVTFFALVQDTDLIVDGRVI